MSPVRGHSEVLSVRGSSVRLFPLLFPLPVLVTVMGKQENRHKCFPKEVKAALPRYSLADRILDRTSTSFFEDNINISVQFPDL